MEEDYGGGLPDLRQLIASTTPFYKTVQYFQEPLPLHRNLSPPSAGPPRFLHQLPVEAADELCPAGGGLLVDHHHHRHTSMFSAVKLEEHGWRNTNNNNFGNFAINDGVGGNNNVINSRWPRQETLTLLEVRSSLDSKFKQTNQKGPLWDEVSRIMAEEHGFQRSGKKCKEKFENLYKYYKKTREGKAGRHDGRNYRFFRQLEAIYGDPRTRNQSSTYGRDLYQNAQNQVVIQDRKLITAESLSFISNSTDEFEQTMSSETNGDYKQSCAGPVVKKSWKAKVEEFVSFQIGKVVETQEAWMENMVKSIENREEERTAREEEWRKQEAARLEQQVHEFWAKERAWVEARDAAVMDALNQFTNGNRM